MHVLFSSRLRVASLLLLLNATTGAVMMRTFVCLFFFFVYLLNFNRLFYEFYGTKIFIFPSSCSVAVKFSASRSIFPISPRMRVAGKYANRWIRG